MSDDVTIPREVARHFARQLRSGAAMPVSSRDDLADLLDPPAPPAPPLRDEVTDAIQRVLDRFPGAPFMADAVLAVVRRRIEGLPITCPNVGSGWMDRDTVLRLLDGDQ